MTIASIMVAGWYLGRLLRIDGDTSLLVSAGTSICGGSAIVAVGGALVATTVKLVRTLWILPLALVVALFRRRKTALVGFPWFVLFFILAAGVRSIWPKHEAAYQLIKRAAVTGLTFSLFLIGAGVSRESLKVAGVRPLMLGVALWIGAAALGLLSVWLFESHLGMIAG